MRIEIKSVTIKMKWWQAVLIIVAIILAFKVNPAYAWELLKPWLQP